MSILVIFLGLYIIVGILYAIYLTSVGASPWYHFLLTVFIGPITLTYVTIKTLKRERIDF